MYKNKEQQREYDRERKRKSRTNTPETPANVLPEQVECPTHVLPDVTPQDTVSHPHTIQCGAITYQWHDAPAWLQRSYMGSNHKWESMLVCVPDYTRPAILGKVGGALGVGGMDGGCGRGALPSDTNIILKTNPLYPTLDGDRPIGCKPVLDIGLGSGGNPTRVATVKTPITLPSDTQINIKGFTTQCP